MNSIWRTERPRFPLYSSDGNGRDYYIKFTNGGYWENQFHVTKKESYEKVGYSNYHTLFHQAAPYKYWSDGRGRQSYIIGTNGLIHDEKPLCSFKLIDFLRNDSESKSMYNKKIRISRSEKKYFDTLRKKEKGLINRLYTEPMKKKIGFLKNTRKYNYSLPQLDENILKETSNFCGNDKISDKGIIQTEIESYKYKRFGTPNPVKKLNKAGSFNKTLGNDKNYSSRNDNRLMPAKTIDLLQKKKKIPTIDINSNLDLKKMINFDNNKIRGFQNFRKGNGREIRVIQDNNKSLKKIYEPKMTQ